MKSGSAIRGAIVVIDDVMFWANGEIKAYGMSIKYSSHASTVAPGIGRKEGQNVEVTMPA